MAELGRFIRAKCTGSLVLHFDSRQSAQHRQDATVVVPLLSDHAASSWTDLIQARSLVLLSLRRMQAQHQRGARLQRDADSSMST